MGNYKKRKHEKHCVSSGCAVVGAARGTWTNFVRNDQKQSYSQFHPPPLSPAFLIAHESSKTSDNFVIDIQSIGNTQSSNK